MSGSVYYSPGLPRTEVTVRGACTPEGMSRSSGSISGGRDLVASPVRRQCPVVFESSKSRSGVAERPDRSGLARFELNAETNKAVEYMFPIGQDLTICGCSHSTADIFLHLT